METRKLYISLLISIFLVSVIVRLDNLTQTMGKHHEYITGHVLAVNSIYEQDGLAELYFAAPWTFNNKADRFFVNTEHVHDENNVSYYVSYPPFCFLAAYVFQIPFGGPSVATIRIFSLLIHLGCALLVFSLLNTLFKKKMSDGFYLPSLAGYVIYLFAPGNLWFHGNVYFADILVHLFVLGVLNVFAKFLSGEYSMKKTGRLFFVLFFVGVYTEWIMVLLAFLLGVYFLFRWFKDKSYMQLMLVLFFATTLSLTLTFVQYSVISGVDIFLKQQSDKLKQRTGMVEEAAEYNRSYFHSESFSRIKEHYTTNYGSVITMVIVCALVLLVLLMMKNVREGFLSRNHHFILLLAMVVLSILLHHTLLYNFTSVHDFSTLKSSIFFSLFIAFVFHQVYLFIDFKGAVKYLFLISLLLISYFSVKEYKGVNNESIKNVDQYNLGQIITQNVTDDEMVGTMFFVSPEMMYYSKRTVKSFNNIEEFVDYAKRVNYDKIAFISKKDDATYTLTHMDKGMVRGKKDFKILKH